MCDKAVDDYLAALKFVSDWFVTSKMIKILFTTLYADENILYFNEDLFVIEWVFLIQILIILTFSMPGLEELKIWVHVTLREYFPSVVLSYLTLH